MIITSNNTKVLCKIITNNNLQMILVILKYNNKANSYLLKIKIRRHSKIKQCKNPQLINLSLNKTNENEYKMKIT